MSLSVRIETSATDRQLKREAFLGSADETQFGYANRLLLLCSLGRPWRKSNYLLTSPSARVLFLVNVFEL
jgi:hypothetical protein